MKKRKKSLVGWIENDWNFYKDEIISINGRPIQTKKEYCNVPRKVRITIEEIK